uniref:Uncharacterized protein n=1 Tax=Solanum lycopersicum TaxID=4081 RepID=A0A3Q7IEY6_SOLLC
MVAPSPPQWPRPEMYGRRRRKNRSSTIVSGTNNQERKQHRRLRRRRTITSDDIDGDSGIIRNVVPRSIQNTLRDQRAWIREGRRKYEEFKHIKMDPSSSIPEYIDLFKTKREELTSHFIWSSNVKSEVGARVDAHDMALRNLKIPNGVLKNR